jgi:drug/metabolite transporter (DMT)-like permease
MAAFLALFASVTWGCSDYVGGVVSRRHQPLVVVALAYAIGAVVLLPIAAASGAFTSPLGYLPWALAAGVVGLLGLGAFYRALATGTMGVVAPIAGAGAGIPVIVGIARGEAPSAAQILGIAAAVVGVILAGGPELRSGGTRRPILLAALAGGCFGTVFVFLADGAKTSVVMTLLIMRLTSVVLFFAGVGFSRVRPRRPRMPVLGWPMGDIARVLFVGCADVAGNGLYAVASRSGLMSVVAVLASLYPAVTVLLARFLDGERLRHIQTTGIVLVLAGIPLLAAG